MRPRFRTLPATLAIPLVGLLAMAPAHAQSSAAPEMSAAERAAFRAEVHDYLLDNPEVLTEMIAILDARQKAAGAQDDQALVAANAQALFDDGYSYVGGNPEGSITVVEFLDYQCGYCKKAFPDLHELVDQDGDIRLIVKDLPILGAGSSLAARAATATMISKGPEAYAELAEILMTSNGAITDASLDRALSQAGLDVDEIRAGMDDPEIDKRLARNQALAQTLGINGTPTFVFEDQMVRGYVALAEMERLVDALRVTN